MTYEFYRDHLNRVSRSFAFCIEELKPPLRDLVSHMYLMCRIVDTAEDYPWSELKNRKILFKSLHKALENSQFVDIIITDELFLKSIKQEESLLLRDINKLLRAYHDFNRAEQVIIKDLLISMMGGMEFFQLNHTKNKNLFFENLKDVNKYCFYVAGIVGEALSRLVEQVSDFVLNSNSLLQSYHFGLFLQKINLLKDYHSDLLVGRNMVFDYTDLRASLELHAKEALKYINSLGVHRLDYKVFCGWSLFIGLASLPYIDSSYKLNKKFKIPRLKTLTLIRKVELIIEDSHQLEDLFNSLLKGASFVVEPSDNQKDESHQVMKKDFLEGINKDSIKNLSFEKQVPTPLDSASQWTLPYRGQLGVSDMERLVSC